MAKNVYSAQCSYFIKVISKKIFTLLVHLSVHVSSQQYNVLLKIILVW